MCRDNNTLRRDFFSLWESRIVLYLGQSIVIIATFVSVNQSRACFVSSLPSQSRGVVLKRGRQDINLANMATLRREYGDWKYDRF